jgi:hypothetical protein
MCDLASLRRIRSKSLEVDAVEPGERNDLAQQRRDDSRLERFQVASWPARYAAHEVDVEIPSSPQPPQPLMDRGRGDSKCPFRTMPLGHQTDPWRTRIVVPPWRPNSSSMCSPSSA